MRLNGQETFGQLLKRRTLLIPPLVDIRGDAKLLAYIKDRDEAEFDVTELLTKAGFGGNFLIILTERIRGSSHTKGFSVQIPYNKGGYGVIVNLHYGTNECCVRGRMPCESVVTDLDNFYRSLKTAQQQLQTESLAAVKERVAFYQSLASKHRHLGHFAQRLIRDHGLGEAPLVVATTVANAVSEAPVHLAPPLETQPADLQDDSVRKTEQPAEIHQASVGNPQGEATAILPHTQPHKWFYEDMTGLKIYMEAVASVLESGFTTKEKCRELLVSQGVVKQGGGGAGATFTKLVRMEHLVLNPQGFVGLGTMWSHLAAPSGALTTTAAQQEVAQVMQGRLAEEPLISPESNLSTMVNTLIEKKKHIDALHAERAECSKRIAEIDAVLASKEVSEVDALLTSMKALLG